MGTRFSLRDLPGDPPLVEKCGDHAALAREADALGRLAGRRWAPALVAHEPGRLVVTRLPGAPRALASTSAAEARRLGGLLAELHGITGAARGGLWWWDAPADSLDDYRARRAADAEAAVVGTPSSGLARAALADPLPPAGARPFRMVHGDLVEANVVWGPDGPGLVDWEFWRMADPAEDLAYLIAVNGLPAELVDAVLDGYGDPSVAARVRLWTVIVTVDAAGWYLAHGMADEALSALRWARAHAGGARR